MLISESEKNKIEKLENRMTCFYQTVSDYPAFGDSESCSHESQWNVIIDWIKENASATDIKVLEIGAGRSRFGEFLRTHCNVNVHYTAHDVTPINKIFLNKMADKVIISPVEKLAAENQKYHVVFHSYVFEHVVRPLAFLRVIDLILYPGGMHCIECPKYDFFAYIPHSLDHIPLFERLIIKLRQCFFHKAFAIIDDPAVFHLPFRLDRDAVHWVSEKEIRRWYRGRAKVATWHAKSYGIRHWLLNKFLTCRLLVQT